MNSRSSTEELQCESGWRWVVDDSYVNRFERTDGAYVLRSTDEYYANPMNPRHLGWKAYVDVEHVDDDGTYLGYKRRDSPFRIARRWKTPQAAMRAIDKERPLSQNR